MKLNIYAVYDVKAGNFATPFFFLNDGVAIRNFTDLTNDPQSRVNAHPGDYSLYSMGDYDDNSGLVKSKKPLQIVQAASVYKPVIMSNENITRPSDKTNSAPKALEKALGKK